MKAAYEQEMAQLREDAATELLEVAVDVTRVCVCL